MVPTAGSTYAWTIIPGTGGAGSITSGSSPNNRISVTWTGSGTCVLQVNETTPTCSGLPVTIEVTVLPAFTPGTATADQSICYNTIRALLNGTAPSGSTGTFTYQWESSTDGGTVWTAIPGASGLTWQPGSLTQTTAYRLVQTAEGTCGTGLTNTVTITVKQEVVTSGIFHD